MKTTGHLAYGLKVEGDTSATVDSQTVITTGGAAVSWP